MKQALVHMPAICKAVKRLTNEIPRIFMYHRFAAEPDILGRKIDKRTFEWQLSLLKSGWKIITLGDYVKRKKNKPTPRYCADITADDATMTFIKWPSHSLNPTVFRQHFLQL